MALPTVIAKNQTGTPILLPRLGLTCPASPGTITLTDFANFFEVASEEVLETRVAAGDIVVNDGTSDLSTAEALAYLNATGNMNGPVDTPATNALVKLADATGRYTNTTGITVDGSDNMNLGSGNVTTTGTVNATTINTGGTPLSWDDLSDVTLTSEAQGDVAYYNGTAWVNLGGGLAGQVVQSGGAGANVVWADNPGITALGGTWSFSSTTTAADPGSKNFRLNNATQASATALYISDIADSNVDMSTVLGALSSGDRLYIQDERDATAFHLIQLTSAGTDNTGWWTFSITVEDSGVDLTNNRKCGFILLFTGSGGGGGTLDHAALTLNGNLAWATSGHTGTNSTFAAFTGAGAATNLTTTAGGDTSGTWPTLQVNDLTISGEAQGDVLYFNGTNWVRLAPGTDGEVLRTNGAGANPTWTAIGTLASRVDNITLTASSGSPYIETTSATYDTLAHIGFLGTDDNTPTSIAALVGQASPGTASVRVYDVTNALVIAEAAGLTNSTLTITDLGTLSNLSTGPATWQVQALKTGGGNKAQVGGLTVVY